MAGRISEGRIRKPGEPKRRVEVSPDVDTLLNQQLGPAVDLNQRLNNAHESLVGLLSRGVSNARGLIDPSAMMAMLRDPKLMEAMRYFVGPGQLDPSAAFLTPGFAQRRLGPYIPGGGPPIPLKMWNQAASGIEPGWWNQPSNLPGRNLPLRPYPFMPQPGTGPVFRTNPQPGPVRNIAGMRRYG